MDRKKETLNSLSNQFVALTQRIFDMVTTSKAAVAVAIDGDINNSASFPRYVSVKSASHCPQADGIREHLLHRTTKIATSAKKPHSSLSFDTREAPGLILDVGSNKRSYGHIVVAIEPSPNSQSNHRIDEVAMMREIVDSINDCLPHFRRGNLRNLFESDPYVKMVYGTLLDRSSIYCIELS